ncbi:MAG: hypothetical protein ACRC8A_06255 [Microcoleaceae cyanobacterium]
MKKIRTLAQLLFSVTVIANVAGSALADAPAYSIPKRTPHSKPSSGDCHTPYSKLARPLPQPIEPDHPLTSPPCEGDWGSWDSHAPRPTERHYPEDPYQHLEPYQHRSSRSATAPYRSTLWPEFAWIKNPAKPTLDGIFTILIALGLWWWFNSFFSSPKPEPRDKS